MHHHIGIAAHGNDEAVLYGNRFGAHGIVFHGQDRSAMPDPVGDVLRIGVRYSNEIDKKKQEEIRLSGGHRTFLFLLTFEFNHTIGQSL